MKQFTQEGMFNELSKVTRAINNKNMSKYDLPTYGTGGEDPVKPVDSDKDYLIRMANSPLFVERYARMVGKPIDQVGEEAEAYRKKILSNIETVKVNDVGVLPPNHESFEKMGAHGFYVAPLSKDAEVFKPLQDAINNKALRKKEKKYFSDQLDELVNDYNKDKHSVYLNTNNPWTRLHELSHASVNGSVDKIVADPIKFKPYETPPEGQKVNSLIENVMVTNKPYLENPDEQKVRVDVARKYLESKGLYDPVNENFTEEHLKKLQDSMNPRDFDIAPQLIDLMLPYETKDKLRLFNDFVDNGSKKELNQARLGGLAKFVDGGGTEYSFSGRPDSRYKKINNQWYINNSTTGGKFVVINDPSGERTQILNSKATPVNSFQSAPMVNNVLLTNGKSSKEYYVQQNQFSPEIAKSQLAAKYNEEIRQEAVKNKLAEEQKRYRASIPKGPVADNTRTVIPGNAVSDINNTAILNSPEYKAQQKAKKEAQAEFEKQTWEDYDKMSFGEKALDRMRAGMVDPLGMISRAVTGDQAYIPGMGRGLLNHDSENYENYLNSVGYTPGEFEASDLQNMLNPMYWGAHAGNELHKGNYANGLLETGLTLAFLPGSGRTAVQGVKSLAQDINQGSKYLNKTLGNVHTINPWANKLNKYNRVVGEDAILDLQNSGLVRAGDYGGVENNFEFFDGTRTTPYPSFGTGAPRQTYIDQTIQQGKKPFIISTDRPMKVSNLGRHGKGSTMFPVDETGKYMPAFSADDVKVFGNKPHWLKGYPEIPKELPGSPNATDLFNTHSYKSVGSGIDDGALRSNVSSNTGSGYFIDNSALEPAAGSKLGNNDKFTYFDENWEHYNAYKDNPQMGITGEMAEKFALENPDRFTKVTFDDYDSWLYGKITRETQQKAFAQGKEFANKWLVKDQKYFDDVNAIIKEKTDDMMHNAHIVNGVDVRAQYHKLRLEAQEKALQDLNISYDDFTQNLGKVGQGDKIIDAQIEAVRLERDSNLSKLVNSSSENLKLHDDFMAYEQRYSALQNERDALRKSLDAAIDPEYKRKVEELYAMSGQTDVPATMSSVELREPKLVNVNRTDPSFKQLDPYNQEYLLKNNHQIGGVRTYNNTITLGARPTGNTTSFRYFTKNSQAENIANRVNADGMVIKEAQLSKPSTWLNPFKKPTYKTYPDTELGKAQQRLEQMYGHEINPDDIELAERIEQELIMPERIEEVNAHEIFHDLQNTNGRWIDLFTNDSETAKYAYNTTHEKTAIAKEFKTYMVDPVEEVNAAGEKIMSNETWLASVGELHSELGVARLRAAKKYMEQGLSMDEAIATLKTYEKEGNEELFDFYLDYSGGGLNKHFKDSAPVEIKRQLLKILPVAIPAIGLTGLSLQGEASPLPTQKKYGGNISNLQKFIK